MRNASLAMLALALSLLAPAAAQSVSDQKAYEIARDAYMYGYPIVTMDVSRRQATNVPDANTISLRAPINQFAHARTYPRAEDRDVKQRLLQALLQSLLRRQRCNSIVTEPVTDPVTRVTPLSGR